LIQAIAPIISLSKYAIAHKRGIAGFYAYRLFCKL
jgi:hypothetical protein